jgi:adenine-specific DNA-methyltransferase
VDEHESRIRDHRHLATQLLDHGDALRREVAPSLALKRKSALGQFMTPSPEARFMASLFPPTNLQNCHLLDAGAGVGALSCAFLDRLASAEELNFQNVEVEAYEIENALRAHLETTLASYAERLLSPTRFHPVISFGRLRAKC